MKFAIVVALFATVASLRGSRCAAIADLTTQTPSPALTTEQALEALHTASAPTGVSFTGELERLDKETEEDTTENQESFGHRHRRRHGRWGWWDRYGPYRFKFSCDGYGGWAYPLGYWNTLGAGLYGGGCGFGRAWGGLYYC
ncbi:hypothetical protein Poli38472_013980 [Pythium oligandrum]|uniref:Uncharacterized protein n=1 Tax=Pythium oligandrum TaxID=41045 RepID=A0A8K1CQT4_PYTOL|nr:hypothetical protein Poli38472_013980 [Pythium oligandrum]|eukprot:TMW66668.1 hypothetical protein Poli38472_013980 [Pythium oligandrum]